MRYAFHLWKTLCWRTTRLVLALFGAAFACVVTYAVCVVFVDAAVWIGGEQLDFIALTIVFATLNLLPHIVETFAADHQIARSLKQLTTVVNLAATRAQSGFATGRSFLGDKATRAHFCFVPRAREKLGIDAAMNAGGGRCI